MDNNRKRIWEIENIYSVILWIESTFLYAIPQNCGHNTFKRSRSILIYKDISRRNRRWIALCCPQKVKMGAITQRSKRIEPNTDTSEVFWDGNVTFRESLLILAVFERLSECRQLQMGLSVPPQARGPAFPHNSGRSQALTARACTRP